MTFFTCRVVSSTHARIVADDGEVFHAAFMQCGDEILWDPAQPEPARGDGHVVVEQAGQCRLGVRVNFAHVERDLITNCAIGHG